MRILLVLICVLSATYGVAQTSGQDLKKHIQYLAADELAGREAGSEGEKKAAEYISKQFELLGLEAKGTNGYYQDFEFLAGRDYGKSNQLTIGKSKLTLDEDYYPLNFSGNDKVQANAVDAGFGIDAPDLEYNDYKSFSSGAIALINISSPDGIHPHSKYLNYHSLRSRAESAKKHGATGVVFYTTGDADGPRKQYENKIASVGIPVVFATADMTSQAGSKIKLSVELNEDRRTARNVIAQLNNNKDQTVIIGAHFDHLGLGRHGGSLHRGEEAIHNGADDNASGTAMLIELANQIKAKGLNNYNYLFIAFSGEEKGLLGANYFTKNATIDIKSANYMINMDMVGRLNEEKNSIAINGVGTSPVWPELLENLDHQGLSFATTQSGVGPSDHTAFYLSDMPVLHFFSGTHAEYHKPTDDEHLINYPGMVKINNIIFELISTLDAKPALEFTKTKDNEGKRSVRFSVTLGVVPDYMWEKAGLKVDGVSDGKPAQAAGIQKGDIITKNG